MPTAYRDLDLLLDTRTGALTFATASAVRTIGNYVKRGETLKLSLTIQEDGVDSTSIPANLKGTLKPVGNYAPSASLATWSGFVQAGSTNVFTASATVNAASVTTLLGLVQDFVNCVFDFAGDGVNESDTLGIVLRNNVTRDDDTAPTVLVSRSDFLVTGGTGLTVNVGLGILPTGASVAAQGPLSLSDNATNYVELNSSGVASKNTSGFTDGYAPLAIVVTSSGAITSNSDRRPWIDFKGAGASSDVVPQINGYADGTWVSGIATVSLTLGTLYRFVDDDGILRQFYLKSGTDATTAPSPVRASDYNAGTNQRVWFQVS